MPVIGHVISTKAHIVKHHWNDRFGKHGISYLLRLNKDEFESFLKDRLPAKHNEESDAYFINITPVSKEYPGATIPEESAFVGRSVTRFSGNYI